MSTHYYYMWHHNSLTCRSNELALVPAGTQPKHRIVEPKLALMEKRIAQLDTVIFKLVSG